MERTDTVSYEKTQQVKYLQRKGMMIAFLVFLAVMIAFIVGSVCISMYLYSRNCIESSQEPQLVTLNQEAFVERKSSKQRRRKLDTGMGECVGRVCAISLGVVVVMLILIIALFNAAL